MITIRVKNILINPSVLPVNEETSLQSYTCFVLISYFIKIGKVKIKFLSAFLIRLCRYFNGKHHLEEIMYYENLRRNQLLTLLEKFRKVLFICQHEDMATVYDNNTSTFQ